MAQTQYIRNNKDGFNDSLKEFMQNVETRTRELASGGLNSQNIEGFLEKVEQLGEAEIQKFRERLNPSLKA